jgi:hypothetical protein
MSESSPAPPPASSSVWSRLTNVLVEPGTVFAEVNATRNCTANWLVPALLLSVAGIFASFVIFSQPNIVQKLHEQQAKALDQQVEAGKMTQAQADQALAMIDKIMGPTMMKIFGSVGSVLGSFARVFWWALILWLLSRIFLKKRFSYLKAVEVSGLTTTIILLSVVVGALLTMFFGRLGASPSLALMVSDFDMKNRFHLLMAAANIFYFWEVVVLSIGLSRLSGAPFSRALALVGGYWLVTEFLAIACNLAGFAM